VIIEEHILYTYEITYQGYIDDTPYKRLRSSVSRPRRGEALRSIVPEWIVGQGTSFLEDRFDLGTIVDFIALSVQLPARSYGIHVSLFFSLVTEGSPISNVSEGLSRGESSITSKPSSISTRY